MSQDNFSEDFSRKRPPPVSDLATLGNLSGRLWEVRLCDSRVSTNMIAY